jgi:hypothetical protein
MRKYDKVLIIGQHSSGCGAGEPNIFVQNNPGVHPFNFSFFMRKFRSLRSWEEFREMQKGGHPEDGHAERHQTYPQDNPLMGYNGGTA